MENIKKILIERGYPEKAAETTASNIAKLSGEMKEAIQTWLHTNKETDMGSNGYTISSLMNRFKGMTYPAALLTIDWLKREPETAKKAIERGLR